MTRAQRFEMALPIRYRPADNEPWLSGTTVNISRSGVLFSVDRAVPPDTPIEMNLIMPSQIVGPGGSQVVCCGRVVRTAPAPTPEARPALAATIAEYRLVRSDRGDEAS